MHDQILVVYLVLHYKKEKVGGKVQDSHNDLITVYTDATIAFPILALYVLSNQKPRKHKRLYKKLDEYYKSLQNDVIKIPDKFAKILKENEINLD